MLLVHSYKDIQKNGITFFEGHHNIVIKSKDKPGENQGQRYRNWASAATFSFVFLSSPYTNSDNSTSILREQKIFPSGELNLALSSTSTPTPAQLSALGGWQPFHRWENQTWSSEATRVRPRWYRSRRGNRSRHGNRTSDSFFSPTSLLLWLSIFL